MTFSQIRLSPPSFDDGYRLYQRGKYLEAIQKFTLFIESTQNLKAHCRALLFRGICLFKQNKLDLAYTDLYHGLISILNPEHWTPLDKEAFQLIIDCLMACVQDQLKTSELPTSKLHKLKYPKEKFYSCRFHIERSKELSGISDYALLHNIIALWLHRTKIDCEYPIDSAEKTIAHLIFKAHAAHSAAENPLQDNTKFEATLQKGKQFLLQKEYKKAEACYETINNVMVSSFYCHLTNEFEKMMRQKENFKNQTVADEKLYEQAFLLSDAALHYQNGNVEDAIQSCVSANFYFSDNPFVWTFLGRIYYQEGQKRPDPKKAQSFYRDAVRCQTRALDCYKELNADILFHRSSALSSLHDDPDVYFDIVSLLLCDKEHHFSDNEKRRHVLHSLIPWQNRLAINQVNLTEDSEFAAAIFDKQKEFETNPVNASLFTLRAQRFAEFNRPVLEVINYATAFWLLNTKMDTNPKRIALEKLRGILFNRLHVCARMTEEEYPAIAKRFLDLADIIKTEQLEESRKEKPMCPDDLSERPKKTPPEKEKIIEETCVADTKEEAPTRRSMELPNIKIQYTPAILDIFKRLDIPEIPRIFVVGGYVCEALVPQKNITDVDFVLGTTASSLKDLLTEKFPDAKITQTSDRDYTVRFENGDKYDFRHSEALSDMKLTKEEAVRLDSDDRDFAANAMYGEKPQKDETTAAVLDSRGHGYKNLKEGKLSSIKPMKESFAKDPIRMLRAIYFKNKRKWKMSVPMLETIKNIDPSIIKQKFEDPQSRGRVNHWMKKLLCSGQAVQNFQSLHESNLLSLLFPDVARWVKRDKKFKDYVYRILQDTDHLVAGKNTTNINYIYACWIVLLSKKTDKTIETLIEENLFFKTNFESLTPEKRMTIFGHAQRHCKYFDTKPLEEKKQFAAQPKQANHLLQQMKMNSQQDNPPAHLMSGASPKEWDEYFKQIRVERTDALKNPSRLFHAVSLKTTAEFKRTAALR